MLDPAETRLVPDPAPGFADSRLYLESQLRQAVPNDERIHVAHGAAMDPVHYEFEPARQALRQPRQRIWKASACSSRSSLSAWRTPSSCRMSLNRYEAISSFR